MSRAFILRSIERRPRAEVRHSGSGVYHLITTLGERVGIKARPHGLRHTAVTEALNVFSGDYRKVRAFSRHSSLDSPMRNAHGRVDAGQIALRPSNLLFIRLIAASFSSRLRVRVLVICPVIPLPDRMSSPRSTGAYASIHFWSLASSRQPPGRAWRHGGRGLRIALHHRPWLAGSPVAS